MVGLANSLIKGADEVRGDTLRAVSLHGLAISDGTHVDTRGNQALLLRSAGDAVSHDVSRAIGLLRTVIEEQKKAHHMY